MTLIQRLLAGAFIIILAASAWLWWNRPRKTDMAGYAPADALVYLECNSLLDIGESIVTTNAWRDLTPLLGTAGRPLPGRWLRQLISWTGIGPTQSVILTRAQVATVILDLGTTERGETLTIRPEAAILIETHTSQRRARPVVEEALRRFAETVYEGPSLQKTDVAGAEFIIWSAATTDHRIVATISGSLVIVGNSEKAVKACLDVQRGLRPSLQNDVELHQMRHNLAANQALAFGFISSENAGRLVSTAAPLLLGRAPGDQRFDRIVASGASKILTGVGWSSRPSSGGIEDRYLFSLTPNLVSRVRPYFKATGIKLETLQVLPDDVYSVTVYKFENPLATWQVLQTSVSAQLDTLSAIMFTSLLKSGLSPYGVEDPEQFLRAVGPELLTMRLARDSEKSLLMAQIRDEKALRQLLLGPMVRQGNSGSGQDGELIEIPGKEIAVSFLKGNVFIGLPEDVRRCIEAARERPSIPHPGRFERQPFLRDSNSAGVATYASDGERVMNFLRTIVRMSGARGVTSESSELMDKLDGLPYSATETTLGEQGLERRTQSSFGQFGALLPLLIPDR